MRRSSTSMSSTPSSGLIHFAYEIERGVRFHSDPMELIGFRRITVETREPVVVNEDVETGRPKPATRS